MGADFIEPDLVSTKDGVLIARHENEIGGDDRRRGRGFPIASGPRRSTASRSPAGSPRTSRSRRSRRCARASGWPFRSHAYDGQFEIPTFDEVIALAQQLGSARGRPVGVYPETKHPTYFRSIGCRSRSRCSRRLSKHGWNRRDAPVFIQSFEQGNLRELRKKTKVRLVQLVERRGDGRRATG